MHKKREKSKLRFFIYKKFKKLFYFFTCILPDYVPNESYIEFSKDSHMRAGFLLRSQKSLWQTTHEMMHFQA